MAKRKPPIFSDSKIDTIRDLLRTREDAPRDPNAFKKWATTTFNGVSFTIMEIMEEQIKSAHEGGGNYYFHPTQLVELCRAMHRCEKLISGLAPHYVDDAAAPPGGSPVNEHDVKFQRFVSRLIGADGG